jgi:outer membrane protein TolC
MNKAYWVPKLNGFLDLGSQASDWKFNNKSKYYFFGFQLDFPLFSAGKNRNRIKHAELDLKNQLIIIPIPVTRSSYQPTWPGIV